MKELFEIFLLVKGIPFRCRWHGVRQCPELVPQQSQGLSDVLVYPFFCHGDKHAACPYQYFPQTTPKMVGYALTPVETLKGITMGSSGTSHAVSSEFAMEKGVLLILPKLMFAENFLQTETLRSGYVSLAFGGLHGTAQLGCPCLLCSRTTIALKMRGF